jgi:hypothetical protein
MDKSTHFSFMMDALTELADKEPTQHISSVTDLPVLISTLANSSRLPDTALFLGLAEDGLPVLLDLCDPVPGPLLIIGDEESGKTSFLQMIARSIELLHSPSDVQSGIITQYPEEWATFQDSQSVVGIYPTQEGTASDLLQPLVKWAHNNKENRQSILLLIDDLEAITKLDPQTVQNLRWLLLRGPSRRVWPIVTTNASCAPNMEAWLGFFRTRLFGHNRDAHNSHFIANDPDKVFDDLAACQFTMREGNNWLNFWAPAID